MRRGPYLSLPLLLLPVACGTSRLNLGADSNATRDAGASNDAGDRDGSPDTIDVGMSGPRVTIDATTRLFLAPQASCARDAGGDLACLGVGHRGQLAVAPRSLASDCGGRACTYLAKEALIYQSLDVSLSALFGCAAIGDGVLCFGENDLGQLGRNSVDSEAHALPEYVANNTWDPQRVTLGLGHACALDSSRTVSCWGFGGHGQLGVDPATLDICGVVASREQAEALGLSLGGEIRCASAPVRAFGIIDATSVSAGGHGTCVARATGELRCFGRNQNGSLGFGEDTDILSPKPSSLANVAEVFLGQHHGCALSRDKRLHCWGENAHGQLGLGYVSKTSCAGVPCERSPRETLFRSVDLVALGATSTLVLRQDARVFAVGDDREGQLGDGPSAPERCAASRCAITPVEVALPSGAFTIAAGSAHACAVLANDRTMCWGRGSEGQTGSSFFESSDAPIDVTLRAAQD